MGIFKTKKPAISLAINNQLDNFCSSPGDTNTRIKNARMSVQFQATSLPAPSTTLQKFRPAGPTAAADRSWPSSPPL